MPRARIEPANELVAELGVGLHGEGAAVVKQGGILAEVVAGDDVGGLRHLRHLVAMPGVQRQAFAAEIVAGGADGPAVVKAFDRAAHRLCHDLVAEADAHHRHMLGKGLADEVFQRGNEGMVFIDPVARAGDEPAIAVMDRGREV
ncbi:MAG: hypothetical protein MZV65_02370, partial [Chromatiales bacterium]|nr:hypothetical protein [Chromatiales bacterium]